MLFLIHLFHHIFRISLSVHFPPKFLQSMTFQICNDVKNPSTIERRRHIRSYNATSDVKKVFQVGAVTSPESGSSRVRELRLDSGLTSMFLPQCQTAFLQRLMTAHLHNIDAKQHSENLAAFLYSEPTNSSRGLPPNFKCR